MSLLLGLPILGHILRAHHLIYVLVNIYIYIFCGCLITTTCYKLSVAYPGLKLTINQLQCQIHIHVYQGHNKGWSISGFASTWFLNPIFQIIPNPIYFPRNLNQLNLWLGFRVTSIASAQEFFFKNSLRHHSPWA